MMDIPTFHPVGLNLYLPALLPKDAGVANEL
jgi:hypothetical protein